MIRPPRVPRAFWEALGLNAAWMNASEVARYFLLVKPRVAVDFPEVAGIVPDGLSIGLLWVVWDTVLVLAATVILWLILERFGPRRAVGFAAATLVWASVFVLLWLGLHNMGLAKPGTALAALPLAWLELAVAAEIVRWRMGGALTAPRAPAATAG